MELGHARKSIVANEMLALENPQMNWKSSKQNPYTFYTLKQHIQESVQRGKDHLRDRYHLAR
jgi:hypothetical protein